MKRIAIVGASFLANLAILFGSVVFLSGVLGGAMTIVAVALLGFSVGCALGSAFRTATALPVALGAFGAALIMWTPVVVVTYGFALLGLPLLIGYAACVGAGARMVKRTA